MPRIFDNIDLQLLPALRETQQVALGAELARIGREYVNDLKRNARPTVRVYKGRKSVGVLSLCEGIQTHHRRNRPRAGKALRVHRRRVGFHHQL